MKSDIRSLHEVPVESQTGHACSRLAMISSICPMPIHSVIISGVTPNDACIVMCHLLLNIAIYFVINNTLAIIPI